MRRWTFGENFSILLSGDLRRSGVFLFRTKCATMRIAKFRKWIGGGCSPTTSRTCRKRRQRHPAFERGRGEGEGGRNHGSWNFCALPRAGLRHDRETRFCPGMHFLKCIQKAIALFLRKSLRRLLITIIEDAILILAVATRSRKERNNARVSIHFRPSLFGPKLDLFYFIRCNFRLISFKATGPFIR